MRSYFQAFYDWLICPQKFLLSFHTIEKLCNLLWDATQINTGRRQSAHNIWLSMRKYWMIICFIAQKVQNPFCVLLNKQGCLGYN